MIEDFRIDRTAQQKIGELISDYKRKRKVGNPIPAIVVLEKEVNSVLDEQVITIGMYDSYQEGLDHLLDCELFSFVIAVPPNLEKMFTGKMLVWANGNFSLVD